jgi:hypothetical protein
MPTVLKSNIAPFAFLALPGPNTAGQSIYPAFSHDLPFAHQDTLPSPYRNADGR